jgi:hypothetical protein
MTNCREELNANIDTGDGYLLPVSDNQSLDSDFNVSYILCVLDNNKMGFEIMYITNRKIFSQYNRTNS